MWFQIEIIFLIDVSKILRAVIKLRTNKTKLEQQLT